MRQIYVPVRGQLFRTGSMLILKRCSGKESPNTVYIVRVCNLLYHHLVHTIFDALWDGGCYLWDSKSI